MGGTKGGEGLRETQEEGKVKEEDKGDTLGGKGVAVETEQPSVESSSAVVVGPESDSTGTRSISTRTVESPELISDDDTLTNVGTTNSLVASGVSEISDAEQGSVSNSTPPVPSALSTASIESVASEDLLPQTVSPTEPTDSLGVLATNITEHASSVKRAKSTLDFLKPERALKNVKNKANGVFLSIATSIRTLSRHHQNVMSVDLTSNGQASADEDEGGAADDNEAAAAASVGSKGRSKVRGLKVGGTKAPLRPLQRLLSKGGSSRGSGSDSDSGGEREWKRDSLFGDGDDQTSLVRSRAPSVAAAVIKLVSCRCCLHYVFKAGQTMLDKFLQGSLPVVVAVMILNDAVNRNVLSSVFPIAVFGFLLVHNPRQLPVLPSMLNAHPHTAVEEESRRAMVERNNLLNRRRATTLRRRLTEKEEKDEEEEGVVRQITGDGTAPRGGQRGGTGSGHHHRRSHNAQVGGRASPPTTGNNEISAVAARVIASACRDYLRRRGRSHVGASEPVSSVSGRSSSAQRYSAVGAGGRRHTETLQKLGGTVGVPVRRSHYSDGRGGRAGHLFQDTLDSLGGTGGEIIDASSYADEGAIAPNRGSHSVSRHLGPVGMRVPSESASALHRQHEEEDRRQGFSLSTFQQGVRKKSSFQQEETKTEVATRQSRRQSREARHSRLQRTLSRVSRLDSEANGREEEPSIFDIVSFPAADSESGGGTGGDSKTAKMKRFALWLVSMRHLHPVVQNAPGMFWYGMVIYTVFVICLKFLYQAPIFCVCYGDYESQCEGSGCVTSSYSVWPFCAAEKGQCKIRLQPIGEHYIPYDQWFGVTKIHFGESDARGDATLQLRTGVTAITGLLPDLLVLVAILLHLHVLRSQGYFLLREKASAFIAGAHVRDQSKAWLWRARSALDDVSGAKAGERDEEKTGKKGVLGGRDEEGCEVRGEGKVGVGGIGDDPDKSKEGKNEGEGEEKRKGSNDGDDISCGAVATGRVDTEDMVDVAVEGKGENGAEQAGEGKEGNDSFLSTSSNTAVPEEDGGGSSCCSCRPRRRSLCCSSLCPSSCCGKASASAAMGTVETEGTNEGADELKQEDGGDGTGDGTVKEGGRLTQNRRAWIRFRRARKG